MSNALSELQVRTRQERQLARARVIAEARLLVQKHGTSGIIVSLLARRNGVSALTTRRWLEKAGFDLSGCQRGRPLVDRIAAIEETLETGEV